MNSEPKIGDFVEMRHSQSHYLFSFLLDAKFFCESKFGPHFHWAIRDGHARPPPANICSHMYTYVKTHTSWRACPLWICWNKTKKNVNCIKKKGENRWELRADMPLIGEKRKTEDRSVCVCVLVREAEQCKTEKLGWTDTDSPRCMLGRSSIIWSDKEQKEPISPHVISSFSSRFLLLVNRTFNWCLLN